MAIKKSNSKINDLAKKIEAEKKRMEKLVTPKNVTQSVGKATNGVQTEPKKGNQSSKSEKKADIRKLKKGGKRFSIAEFGITLAIVFAISIGYSMYTESIARGEEVSISEIFAELKDEKYQSPKITLKDNVVILSGDVEKADDVEKIVNKHAVVDKNYSKTDINVDLKDYGVDVTSIDVKVDPGSDTDLILNILWLVLFAVGIFFVYNMLKGMQKNGGQIMDFGQSKARLLFGKKTGVTFDQVAGIDEVKEELVEVVDFLKNPKKYFNIGARIPKGVLLVGAPGTGKTLLAKAVAGEAGVPFFHTSGSEFEEMLVGAGASRVRDLFTKAKRAAPCIIFIDEIDAVAKKRGTVLHSGAGEQTLNQILVEMDGMEEKQNVIVLAATNRPDVLDPAILRPGRFDRSVTVHMPDFEGRKEILKVHSVGKKFADDVDMDTVAKKTIGDSGADLENLLNEAAIMAARDNRKEITQSDLLESWLKVGLGRQKKKNTSQEDLKLTAYHEAGHAVVAKILPDADPVETVSIISRGMSGGVTVFVPEDDTSHVMKKSMLAKLAVGAGGRAAEDVFLDDISTGASSDIQQVTETARVMVQKYGMSENLGFIKYGNLEDVSHLGYQYGGERDYSEKTADLIDAEVKRLADDAMDTAKKILKDNEKIVHKLAKLLVEKEQVDKDEFEELFK